MQTRDATSSQPGAAQLRQQLFQAARQLAEQEHRSSFQLRIPDTDPPLFIALGTRDEIEALVSDEGWQKYGPDDVEEGTLNKQQAPKG